MEAEELPNKERIRILGEKEIYKFLWILEADTIKQVEMREKKETKNISCKLKKFSKLSYIAEISSKA